MYRQKVPSADHALRSGDLPQPGDGLGDRVPVDVPAQDHPDRVRRAQDLKEPPPGRVAGALVDEVVGVHVTESRGEVVFREQRDVHHEDDRHALAAHCLERIERLRLQRPFTVVARDHAEAVVLKQLHPPAPNALANRLLVIPGYRDEVKRAPLKLLFQKVCQCLGNKGIVDACVYSLLKSEWNMARNV